MSTFVIGDVHGRRAQLRRLVELLPLKFGVDALVILGDLIDRGDDVPGAVSDALDLSRGGAVVLKGNHEQMFLDFLDEGARLWLHPAVGSTQTFEQYAGRELTDGLRADPEAARAQIAQAVPAEHVEFFRTRPLYHEDEYAIYVHAGLECGKHPRDCNPYQLLWSRNQDFYRHYTGKPCVFGHTPTPLLPLWGRLGRHGIYISHSAVGIDTGYDERSPLTCLQLPEFNLYQTFADGHTAFHHVSHFLPEPLRAFRGPANGSEPVAH
jgi:serine/threonine protein phosphatase 1